MVMRDRIINLVDEVIGNVEGQGDDGEGPWRVFCTGHSLGGALATLCATDMAVRHSSPAPHQS